MAEKKERPEGVVARTSAGKAGFNELGVTGLTRFGQQVDEEFLPQLKGKQGIKVYREMSDNDPVIGACLLAIEMEIRQAKVRIDPGAPTPENRDYAKFIDEALQDMSFSWADTLVEILSMLPFGWSYHEVVYKPRQGMWATGGSRSKFTDGYVGWRKMPIRSQDSLFGWDFDDNGGIKAMIQQAPPDFKEVPIPIEKSALFRPRIHKGNPEGRSVIRNAYRPWYFKKKMEEIEGMGVERDLAGLPMARVNPDILAADAGSSDGELLASIEKLVRNVRRDQQEGIIFPLEYDDNGNELYTFELLASQGGRAFSTDTIIARYDQRIAMTMLADFILLGHEQVGSFALSDSKTAVFATALGGFLESIADVFNRHIIPRLLQVNGWEPEILPEMHFEDIETPDLTALGGYIGALAAAGVPIMPDDDLEAYLRAAAKLPEKSDETREMQEQLKAQQQQVAMGMGGYDPMQQAQGLQGAMQDAVDQQADQKQQAEEDELKRKRDQKNQAQQVPA